MGSSWICVDANLVIRLIVDPEDEVIRRLWERWDAEHQRVAAPTLLFYEVSNALYRYRRAGMMGPAAVQLALTAALALPITLHGDPTLHTRAIETAERLSLSAAYDAHYLALADILGGEFWTADLRLVSAVQGELPWVHAVSVDR
jgi:predicted nucleic acid-binding protein